MSEKNKIRYFSGSGNIFSVIDNRNINETFDYYAANANDLALPKNIEIAKTDGILVINSSIDYDFDVYFINPDGSSGMMCGNGGRVAIEYAISNEFIENYVDNSLLRFEMNGKVYGGKRRGNDVSIYFPPASTNPLEKEVLLDNTTFSGDYVNVGTEHFVVEVENVANFDVYNIGKQIRNAKEFEPNGVNVNFYQKDKIPNSIELRTYERGVEDETGACGTGAISTALSYFNKYGYNGKLSILPTSKSVLSVELIFEDDIAKIKNIVLTGFVNEIGKHK
jgi:diaminopimelate epimerase